ncbi:hypothetical protein SHELI_v1c09550 [Spiroplasma helicoides]|uniref:RpiR family transcriptional regulator n=1 Tax=Spiroplasma helicoides TaxID=216938 RepID=A0A1B3SLV0_9MOLU|nr:MurR/RpiR family transcriptional regulator [Spiroplasma helicoides]AOG60904.1 hypothetical protein SHELI_v1c09550 [Spiroplasma helicoides]
MKENERKLTYYEQITYDKILKNPSFFIDSSLKDLAKVYNISDASIVRLIKKMGYKSLKNMQMDFYNKLELEKLMSINCEEGEDYSTKFLAKEILAYSIYSIIETNKNLDYKLMNDLGYKFVKSSKILVFGVGNSQITAKYFSTLISKLGLFSTYSDSIHNNLISMQFMTKNDVLVVFSSQLKTKECVKTIQIANKNNICVVLVTTIKELNEYIRADYIVNYSKHSLEYNNFPTFSSNVGQMYVSNILFNIISKKVDYYQAKIKKANILIDDWNK